MYRGEAGGGMREDERQERLVDMLLWELVGKETPPDVRGRVMKVVETRPEPVVAAVRPGRVARRSVYRPAKRSTMPVLAFAAAVALLVGGWALLRVQQIAAARTPVLSEVSGAVNRSGGAVLPGETVVTGAGARARLSYPDGTRVEVLPETTVVVAERSAWERSKGLELVGGRLEAEVAAQVAGAPFVLVSDDARAEVVGTRLSFHRGGDSTRLEVTEGAVRFEPLMAGEAVLVEAGLFAEAGATGLRTGAIPPVRGLTGFTLMNADTDLPVGGGFLEDGATVSLGALPTRSINIRADYDGEVPPVVRFRLERQDGGETGLPAHAGDDRNYPPFFVAGDHWNDGRPNDCRAWTPAPGRYRLEAEAVYDGGSPEPQLEIEFEISD